MRTPGTIKTRKVTIFSGKRFTVPQGIQRIDHKATHGWQLRYGGTKLFSDGTNDGSGARASLLRATAELHRRIATLPAPSRLQRVPNGSKTSDLPVGISGPIVRNRPGSQLRESSLSISLPRFGQASKRTSVYIGTENTYTSRRYREALAKAIAIRQAAELTYERAATRAKRAASRAMREKA